MGLTRDFSNDYIVVPKHVLDEPETPVTVSGRGTAELTVTLRAVPQAATAADKLDKAGLKRKPLSALTKAPRSTEGQYTPLDTLEMTVVRFANKEEEDRARNELGDSFQFIRDIAMQLPEPIPLEPQAESPVRMTLGTEQWPAESGVTQAHAKDIRGAGVLVGVLDTGIDADHREFKDERVLFRHIPLDPLRGTPRDIRGFDTGGHGTHVCGIIGGKTVGIAPETQLHVASVIESETLQTSLSRVLEGLSWMLELFSFSGNRGKPAILSMSLGFPVGLIQDDDYRHQMGLMRKALKDLKEQANVLPVVAIGNDGEGNYRLPGAFKEALGVGAVDFDKNVPSFSGSGTPPDEDGPKPDVAGYGVQVYSSIERDYDDRSLYARMSGTSMATPYVTGIAALYWSINPHLNANQIETLLLENALEIDPRDRTGAGLVRFRSVT